MLCDNTGFMRATSFDGQKSGALKDGATVTLKNYIPKSDSIIITTKTKVFQSPHFPIDQSIIDEAISALRPATPPPADISSIKSSPVKTLHTVQGTIIQDESPRQVMVKGSPVAVRTITIQQKRDTIKLSLWKEHSSEDVKPGDWLTAKNMVLSEYQKEKQLSSTSRTTLEVLFVIGLDEVETMYIHDGICMYGCTCLGCTPNDMEQ
ncbi:hypothetical protein HOLleu_01868 [Holothuria leucospilota]|uniref:Uncharacterized protein n=1 Tax=Holothuria leucospilota TaxID=206669 RepID=A0A9Q1CQI1_HOLLE|nr:hypothetical protein HOLleu_01868 [Holothuria leucospilota]